MELAVTDDVIPAGMALRAEEPPSSLFTALPSATGAPSGVEPPDTYVPQTRLEVVEVLISPNMPQRHALP